MFNRIQQDDDLEYHRLPDEPKEKERASTWAHMVQLLKFCRSYWGWLTVGLVLLILHSAASIFIPLKTAEAIASIASHDIKAFTKAVIFVILLNIASIFCGGFRAGALNYASGLINNGIRKKLFAALTEQEIAFFYEEDAHTGKFISRLVADCEQMSHTITNNLDSFLRDIFMTVLSIAIMISISWRLTLVTFACMPLLVFCVTLFSAFFARLRGESQDTIACANEVAAEVISSMSTVRSFACEETERTRFEKSLKKTLSVYKKIARALVGNRMLSELTTCVILIAVLIYGGYLARSDRMHVDDMIAFWLYQLNLIQYLLQINAAFSGLMQSVGASRKIFEYVNRKPKIQYDDGEKRKAPATIRGKVEFKNVDFKYPSRDDFSLQDISFYAQPGETVALVGPTGAGKSSIISLLKRFYKSKSGEILLDDIPISEFRHTYFHQKVAMVAQQPVLYARSVRDNILYGCDGTVSEDDMIAAAKQANIHDFIIGTEKGYNTKCGENGVQMSGGQKQRIAIARALVRNPSVLILDEATSALDAVSEHLIQEALTKCCQDRTTIVIAHRLSTVKKADKILVIENGRITQCGPHEELMQQTGGLYFEMVQRQLFTVLDSDDQKDEPIENMPSTSSSNNNK
ncbi:ABC transporter transmembrane region domain-containing protein [Ditylenchus destructor]|nr:ABC transporter transmembrane region domain-containing protein [Ditylenchus destructor]